MSCDPWAAPSDTPGVPTIPGSAVSHQSVRSLDTVCASSERRVPPFSQRRKDVPDSRGSAGAPRGPRFRNSATACCSWRWRGSSAAAAHGSWAGCFFSYLTLREFC
eukprot:gene15654-biopygen684